MYTNNTVDFFAFSEGRVRKVSGNWQYEYDLKDHLGNVRATFANNNGTATLLQADSYYPFGYKMPGLSYQNGAENKFTYNGKELEDEFGLDWYHYGARYYDPVIGRWWNIDPLGQFHSAYLANANNPIIYKDEDGEWVHIAIGAAIGAAAGVYAVYSEKGFKDWDIKDVGRVIVSTGTGAAIAAVPSSAGYLTTTIIGGTRAGGIAALGNVVDQVLAKDSFNNIDGSEVAVSGIVTSLTFGAAQPVSRWIKRQANYRYWGIASKNSKYYRNSGRTPTWVSTMGKHPGISAEIGNVTSEMLNNLFYQMFNSVDRIFSNEAPNGIVTVEEGWCKCIVGEE